MALELDCVEASSESMLKLLELCDSVFSLSDIPIDLRLIVLQVACLPAVVRQNARLIDKVAKYY